jgi:1-hydroxycarotenoid 3,4-desaturase
MNADRVVVVGAGVGGLVSALLLARRGLDVTLVEKAAAPGGKMRQVQAGGAGVDAGPTVFTMRPIFEEIFAEAGESLQAHLRLTPLAVLARHAWGGDERLDLHADARASAEAIGRFSGPHEARRFLAFCAHARRVYNALEGPYIRSSRPTLVGMMTGLGPRGLTTLAGLGPFATLWRALARHFHDPRLQQLFGRYATYCGSSPFAAPATLMLVAQVEMDGVWSVEGGMSAVARALADIARKNGARLRYDTACAEIMVRDGRACAVRLADGEVLDADAVVFNGDVGALAAGLLGPAAGAALPRSPAAQRSLSALTWSINGRTAGFPLLRHNVFFAPDYASEFRDIFERARLPRAGTVYVCAQDRDDAATTIGAPERLLCLVNAPANGDSQTDDCEDILRCEQASFSLLRRAGLTIERDARNTVVTSPRQFEKLFPATGGALYGQASHGWMASFRRPGATCRLPGLYLAGGSVHPGPGVPMAALSGRLAAATLLAHLDSTSRSRGVAISGGTSTRSAATAATG